MGQRLHRRVAAILGRPIRSWVVTPPDAVTGSGAETQYSDDMTIPNPKPSGSGLYAVPAAKLEVEAGGTLASSVQFLDAADDVISEASLQTLATAGSPAAYAIGSTGNASSSAATGTFYSSWSAITSPIPAGTSKLFGLSAYMNWSPYRDDTISPPYNQLAVFTLHVQFGDSAENVLGSVEIATYSGEQKYLGLDPDYYYIYEYQISVAAAFSAGQEITLSAIAAKKRAKMVVSSVRYSNPYCRLESGGYAVQ
jgi:hypothetical protein